MRKSQTKFLTQHRHLIVILLLIIIFGCEENIITDEIPSSITDTDGNIYQTVQIGDQVWIAENLKVKHFRNGDVIPIVSAQEDWLDSSAALCYYNNDTSYYEIYGALYNWHAVNDHRSLAPIGWHVPSDEEWKQLEITLGMSQISADSTNWRGTDESNKLRTTGIDYWWEPNEGATNESGFSALPAGYRRTELGSSFHTLKLNAGFWSSDQFADSLEVYAWFRGLNYSEQRIWRDTIDQRSGLSVRCIMD